MRQEREEADRRARDAFDGMQRRGTVVEAFNPDDL